MQLLWLDYETYYDETYTLGKMTAAEYILDPRFEAIGCAFVGKEGEPIWVDGPELPDYLKTINWQDTYAISHNATFDMAILAWRYGIVPKLMGCTLSMSRAWTEYLIGKSNLKDVAAHHGFKPKGDTVFRMKGVGLMSLQRDPDLLAEYRDYSKHDAYLCKAVFKKLIEDGFPTNQLELVDMAIRMTVVPKLRFDAHLLADHLADVRADKASLLSDVGLANGSQLMSNDKFAALLKAEGIEPPTKMSPTTRQQTWAFSKQDFAFTNLATNDNPHVQALVAARLGIKSTLEESRTETLYKIAQLRWPAGFENAAPIPLKFSGAHTHRWSGDWSINMQNLGRDSKLRFALKAPPGMQIVSVDLSQVEARITAYLAEQDDLLEQFRKGDDVYSRFGEKIFNKPVNKDDTPRERFVGKTAVLSLGYSSGATTFQNMCRVQSKGKVVLDDGEAKKVVDVYRRTNDKICDLWARLDNVVVQMTKGANTRVGPVLFRNDTAILPNMMRLHYPELHQDDKYGRVQWFYKSGRFNKVLYGAKLLENLVQSLAFILVMEAARRVKAKTKGLLMPCHNIHDELLYCVPDAIAPQVAQLVLDEMTRVPDWLAGIPLAAESSIGETYGDC